MQLLNAQESKVTGGKYCLMFLSNGGTGSLAFRTAEMGTPVAIPDSSFATDTMQTLTLPKGFLTATLTGSAEMYVEPHSVHTR